jgi:hypothetical protein
MKRRLTGIASLVAALLFAPIAAFSWGPEGHETISDIAQARLEPQTQAAIVDLLGPDISLSNISNYPDTVRYGPTNFGGLLSQPLAKDAATGSWHFTNIPIENELSQTPTTDELNQYPDCDKQASGTTAQLMGDSVQNCIHAQIKFALSQLSAPRPVPNPQASAAESAQAATLWRDKKIVALSYVVHLVGDEHQPMHTSEDHNDAGGNTEKVKFEGKLEHLHELWDDLIDKTGWQDQTPGASKALAQQLLTNLNSLPPDEVANWISGDVEATINRAIAESFHISQKTIYPGYYKSRSAQPGASPLVLPADYQATMQPIAHKRLQMAGVRLAHILNQVNWDGDKTPNASSVKQNL